MFVVHDRTNLDLGNMDEPPRHDVSPSSTNLWEWRRLPAHMQAKDIFW